MFVCWLTIDLKPLISCSKITFLYQSKIVPFGPYNANRTYMYIYIALGFV